MRPTENTVLAQRIRNTVDAVRADGRRALISFNIDTDRLFPCKCTQFSRDSWACPRLQHRAAELLRCLDALVSVPPPPPFDFLGAARYIILMLFNNEYLLQAKRWFGLLDFISLQRSDEPDSDEIERMVLDLIHSELRRFQIYREAVRKIAYQSSSGQHAFLLLTDLNVEWQCYMQAHDELVYYGPVAEDIHASEAGEIHELSRHQMQALRDFCRVRTDELEQALEKWGLVYLN